MQHQHPTGPVPVPEPRPVAEVRTVWTRSQDTPTAQTWQCTGCHTHVTTALAVCETCGYDRQGNDTYTYTADPRPEHAVALTWPDGETAVDAIKADTAPEALEAARANWPGAVRQMRGTAVPEQPRITPAAGAHRWELSPARLALTTRQITDRYRRMPRCVRERVS